MTRAKKILRFWNRVFLGPKGLRSGWRLLVYFFLVALFDMLFAGAAHWIFGLPLTPRSQGALDAGPMLAYELQLFGAALLAAVLVNLDERRPFGEFGLPLRRAFGLRFWQGALWGIVAITALLAALRATGNFNFGAAAGGGAAIRAAAEWFLVFLAVGFSEEFLFRGYSLRRLAEGMRFWPAALVLSAGFGLLHLGNPREDWLGGLAAGLIALFFCFTVRRTGTLWFAVGFHALWDYGESFVYGVANSGQHAAQELFHSTFRGSAWMTGGGVGPEGSVLVLPLIGVLFLIFDRAFPASRAAALEPQRVGEH